MEFNWQILLFTYLILAFALYGILHWIEVVLDLPISQHEQNPNSSYENLRKIVQTIVYEVTKLPEFHNQGGFSNVDATQTQASFEPKLYEDLLATTVINKIFETYNDKKYENSSGVHSAGSDLDKNFNNERINNNLILNARRCSNDFIAGCSAFSERSESTSMKTSGVIDEIFKEKLRKANCNLSIASTSSTGSELSEYIQNHKISLPDLEIRQRSYIGIDDLNDIEPDLGSFNIDSYDIQANHSDISDNWLFRKPLGNNLSNDSTSSVVSTTAPVGMLVPTPTGDCRTLIGDRNADEISDSSEAGSDFDSVTDDSDIINNQAVGTEEHVEHSLVTQNAYDLPHVLLESKTLIGGKNEKSHFEKIKGSFIDLLEPDSLVSVQSLNGQSPAISEAKNNLILIGERNRYQNDRFTYKNYSSNNTEIKMGKLVGMESKESLIKFDSLELDKTHDKHYMDSMQNSRERMLIPAVGKKDENKNKFAGSIAEREHMKWQNAVELPNNPYSAEALQRRLSQTQSQFNIIDGLTGIRNIETVDETAININPSNPPSDVKSVEVELGLIKLNPERYGRDYYINDSKKASGSREQKTRGDLNLHVIDDENLENDSFAIGDFQVTTNTNSIDTSHESCKNKAKIIALKAGEVDHLCIDNREYNFSKTEAVAVDEYTKLSLSSENTDDSHISSLSLNHFDDNLLTTVSDESESATAVHVYNLSKRETKILRHDIIKRSRIPIGGVLKGPFDSSNCCCSSENIHDLKGGCKSVLGSAIKDFSKSETIKTDEFKSMQSTVQLKSVFLNRSPHKLEMDNVRLINNVLGTSLDTKDVDKLLLKDNHEQVMAENIEIDTISDTKKLIENERINVCIESVYDAQKAHESVENNYAAYETYAGEEYVQPRDNEYNFKSEESRAIRSLLIDPIVDETIEASDAIDLSEYISFRKPTEETHPFEHVQDYERSSDIMVQVSEHKEKSVIEKDVFSLLPSVKALAQTFSQHVNKDLSTQLHRPKTTCPQRFNGNNENCIRNHANHPIAPGYSITARSLSNKFREELRGTMGEKTGRLTPERPCSPVLVPGILKTNVAFFEKLRNQ